MDGFPVVSVITKLGGATAVGRDLGLPTYTTWGWMKRGRVPSWRMPALQELVAKHGLDVGSLKRKEPQVRADWLEKLSKRKRTRKAA